MLQGFALQYPRDTHTHDTAPFMQDLQHILAATDLSEAALPAVDRALQLAAAGGARCTVLHALDLEALALLRDVPGVQAEAVAQRLVAQAREQLETLVREPAQRHGVLPALRVEAGLAGAVVAAQSEGADLLVLGAHGAGWLQRLWLGSTASRLLRTSRCPALVVRRQPGGSYRSVLVALDFSPASLACIRQARRLAPQAELTLLHVFDVPFEEKLHFAGVDPLVLQQFRRQAREQALERLHALAAQAGLAPQQYTGLVMHGAPVRQTLEHAARLACDLIVMGKHGTHRSEELLMGSVTQRVLDATPADVLVVVDPAA